MQSVSKCVAITAVAVLVNSCASTGGSPTFRMPPGSKVQVTQELNVPGGGGRVSIQNGRVMPRRQLTVVEPHCQFFLYRPEEQMREPLVIHPDTFTVRVTNQRFDYAGAKSVQLTQAGGDTRYLVTVIELSSSQQPQVRELRCGIWGVLRLDGWLTLSRMQATLGDLVKLITETE